MTTPIQLLAERTEDGRTRLRVPEVGLFTAAKPTGELVSPGASVGFLLRLGIGHRLLVPPGVHGRIVSPRPERVHEPVGHGAVLYELEPLGSPEELAEVAAAPAASLDGVLVPAPHSGRFWHRPSPDEPAYCSTGDVLRAGTPIGLVEIMKTFTQVAYSTEAGLPDPARVLEVLVGDGDEVEAGQPLLRVEAAG